MTKPASRGETPFRINLEQQKKRAKELLKSLHSIDNSGDSSTTNNISKHSALSRFKQHHPKFSDKKLPAFDLIKLSDTQLVIARELGLPSWPKLKAHIAAMTQSSDAIEAKALSPDAEYKTLHIRCGSDLKTTLPAAGFIGDFLEYSDPYGQGPIIQGDNFIETRAQFLSESYSGLSDLYPELIDINLDDTRASLESADNKLQHAAQQYERVVLWFEHDGYDQLVLSKLMTYFANHKLPEKLEMVSINHFPGSARFIGLGQLPPEAIRLIWQQRQAVSQQQLKLGARVWHALSKPTPQALYSVMQSNESKHLINMNGALLRHLQELPSTLNGLSLTEHLTLEILSEKSMNTGSMFRELMRQHDPLPWLGDIMYWFILQSMTQVSKDVFEITSSDLKKPWHDRVLKITQTGQEVLAGTQNWLSLNPPDRWLGGIKIRSNHPCWHWDNDTEKPTLK